MARKPGVHLPGGLYHVILRGNAQQEIFFDAQDREVLYALLEEGCARFGYRVHAFCLMTNHVHLALQPGDTPLSRGMQNLSFRYARHINRSQGRVGHLFQGRYKALLVEADSQLLELVRYIHLNPVRARTVAAAEDYPYSGHLGYLGRRAFAFLTTDWVLSQFDARVGVARRRYVRFVADGMYEGHREEFHRGQEEARVMGTDRFVERSLSAAGQTGRRPPPLEQVIKAVCERLQTSEQDLARVGRDRLAARARATIGWVVLSAAAGTLTGIGILFGRDVSTLSRQVGQIERQAAGASAQGRALRSLRNAITQA